MTRARYAWPPWPPWDGLSSCETHQFKAPSLQGDPLQIGIVRVSRWNAAVAGVPPPARIVSGRRSTNSFVFVVVGDPISDGFVASLARPGGNLTGFSSQEATMAGKWLELLTEIAPGVKQAAIMFNPDTAPGGGSYFLPEFEAAARSLKVAPIVAPVHSDAQIETVITSLGRPTR